MTRAEIIEKVKARLDELSPFEAIELNDSLNLIDKLLNESTETVLLYYPLHHLTSSVIDKPLAFNEDLSAKMELPDDFLRLAAFKLSSWENEVVNPITPNHPAYKLQENKYTRGGTVKPVVVIKDKALHIFSAASLNDTATIKKYIKYQLPEAITDEKVLNIISWQCAADVLTATGQLNLLTLVKEKLKELLYVRS